MKKGGGLLLGLNLVLSLLALATAGAAIALYWLDPRGAPETEISPATPVTGDDGTRPPPLALGDGPVELADVAAACLPAVVNISTTRTVQAGGPGGNPFFDLLRPFLGDPGPQEAQSLGSGVIVSTDGVILTNHHVVADASEIRVTLADGRELPARAIGSDPESDVAVLRLTPPDGQPLDGLTALAYGDSSDLRQGDAVLAIGNPFGVGQTVTQGIVSATGRAAMGITDYEDFIQTDAAINPGNSGGALVNLRGELVGINPAILSRTGGSHGIGFAIPSNMARPLAEALLRDGHVTRGWLGVAIQDLNPQLARSLGIPATRGVVIMDIEPTGPAATVDLRRGDVISGLDSETIRSSRQFRNLIATRGAGADVRIRRERQGQAGEVQVSLRPRPAVQAGRGRDAARAVDRRAAESAWGEPPDRVGGGRGRPPRRLARRERRLAGGRRGHRRQRTAGRRPGPRRAALRPELPGGDGRDPPRRRPAHRHAPTLTATLSGAAGRGASTSGRWRAP